MEDWRYLPGFDNRYKVSCYGDVFSIQRNSVLKHKCSRCNPRKYVQLTVQSRVLRFYVDDLVARTFIPDKWFEFCNIIHLDGNIENNYPSNLLCKTAVEDLPGEVWGTVSELEGHICISNLGRVKRVDHINNLPEHLIKMYTDFDGYDILNASINGTIYSYRLHRLVATIFIDNINDLPDINHIDGNKRNNCSYNLEWCTKQDNMKHAVKLGLCKNNSELMKSKNRELRSTSIQCIETGQIFGSILDAATYYNVSHGTVADIVHGRTKFSKQLPDHHFIIIKKGDKTI